MNVVLAKTDWFTDVSLLILDRHFLNQLNGQSLLFELDLKSRRSLHKMASSNNIDIKEDVKEDVMEDGGRRVQLYRGRYSS